MVSLRDGGLIDQEILKDVGVKTRMNYRPRCPYGFEGMYRVLEMSRKSYADVMMGFGWLLGKEIIEEQGLEALALFKYV